MPIKRSLSFLPRSVGTLLVLASLMFCGCATFDRIVGSDACGTRNARETPKTDSLPEFDLDPASRLALPARSHDAICESDLEEHIRALTDPRTDGRRAGTPGERVAIDYLSRVFRSLSLDPLHENGSLLHAFEFTSGIDLGPNNILTITSPVAADVSLEVEKDWRPLAFSRSGDVASSPIVFAGYGLLYPGSEELEAIDEYKGVDVRDRWVLVFRDLPESLAPKQRQALQRHASLRYKAMVARDKGARGILFVSGPLAHYRDELAPLRFDASLAGTRISVLSIRDEVAELLFAGTGIPLESIQARLDAEFASASESSEPESGEIPAHPIRPLELSGFRLGGSVDLETQRAEGNNVVGRLRVGREDSRQTIVLGAHFDHLGHGQGSSSLASGHEVGAIHPGADDNASGTAVLIEIAETLAARKRDGLDLGERDFIFAAWSGEELGLLGSHAWVEEQVNPHSNEDGPVAYLNFDMVGRLRERLVVQGLGSSPAWAEILESAAASGDLPITTQQDSYVPTDATSFYTQSVPVLNAFTGVHSEYHTPRDTPDRLNLRGIVQIGELFARIAETLSQAPTPPPYRAQEAPAAAMGRTGFRVFLGTIPDYAQTDIRGVRLSGVAPAGPGEQAGMRSGDIIVEVDGRPIENLYDYTYALEALRVDVATKITVQRGSELIVLKVVPRSRD